MLLRLSDLLHLWFRVTVECLALLTWACLLCAVVCIVLLLILCVLVRIYGRQTLPHLRQLGPDGSKPILVGFFHPYCNAGGGGERVLWVAIRSLQTKYPNVRCVVYTGDTDATGDEIMQRAEQRFNIHLPRPVDFVFLQHRKWVEAEPYPYFTLLGQSLGSMMLGWEAMLKFLPDIYIDTMGYAFTIPMFKYMAGCQTASYVHYPTISTDMLERVAQRTAAHNNANFISQSPLLSLFKLVYYHLFAYVYGMMGSRCDTIMVNSTWTQGHILQIWGAPDRTSIVYPPCDTAEFLQIPLEAHLENPIKSIVSVAQFRPEKDHPLQIKAFKHFLEMIAEENRTKYKLVLLGSCRNDADMQRVNALKDLAAELGIEDRVEFRLNVPFSELKQSLAEATIGIHTMWNEHFGIGVVEIMAAGAIVLAHNSGGPKLDIVVDNNGCKTGFLADSVESYGGAMETIFNMSPADLTTMQINARESVLRFREEEFEAGFRAATESLFSRVTLQ